MQRPKVSRPRCPIEISRSFASILVTRREGRSFGDKEILRKTAATVRWFPAEEIRDNASERGELKGNVPREELGHLSLLPDYLDRIVADRITAARSLAKGETVKLGPNATAVLCSTESERQQPLTEHCAFLCKTAGRSIRLTLGRRAVPFSQDSRFIAGNRHGRRNGRRKLEVEMYSRLTPRACVRRRIIRHRTTAERKATENRFARDSGPWADGRDCSATVTVAPCL